MRHRVYGQGTVRFLEDDLANVRFADGPKDVALSDLSPLLGLEGKIAAGRTDPVLQVISRAQAEAIRSVNGRWGVFARSKIDLLPHQLWVCHRVTQEWPARWLIADDVGLGKTIEAGLIAMALLSRSKVKRLLVLCPASLVGQWQKRLREMFGVKLRPYSSDADAQDGFFWEDTDAVVASLDTVKLDSKERLKRLLEAPGWDLLIVDEAHRLGASPQGSTQAFRLVKTLMERKVESALFFTGTPHRGHDFGFYALLQLLRPKWFDPKRPAKAQLGRLGEAVIRNNKALVTDMQGQKLFQELYVSSQTYSYSPAESRFYDRMTDFIASGQGYASSLAEKEGRAVMLVLIAMQKLASSSVAAILGAIETRLSNLRLHARDLRDLQSDYEQALQDDEGDRAGELEEKLAAGSASLQLMQGEEAALRALRVDGEGVGEETKIKTILELVKTRFAGRSVLFFTEYKATQRLLLEALFTEFGDDSATFINGDGALRRVMMPAGHVSDLKSDRFEAAQSFNAGQARFLISTEAGGEGIDLHGSCHTLVHVDLPWNPMRLHQRVGRLHRYGQKERVEVVSFRNPETVESLVWEHLNAKLGRISQSLNAVMDAPEDLLQLVLGMSGGPWNEIFVGAARVKRENLGAWFDEKTQKLGGEDVLEAVRSLVGEASRFEFGAQGAHLPRVDLPDLKPFLSLALELNGHRLLEGRFKTPEAWKKNQAWGTFLPDEYEGVSFERRPNAPDAAIAQLIGAGHNAFESALDQACELEAALAILPPDIQGERLAVFRVFDRLSDTAHKRGFLLGVDGQGQVLGDWEVLQKLNSWSGKRALRTSEEVAVLAPDVQEWLEQAQRHAQEHVSTTDWGFRKPAIEPLVAVTTQI